MATYRYQAFDKNENKVNSVSCEITKKLRAEIDKIMN